MRFVKQKDNDKDASSDTLDAEGLKPDYQIIR